MIKKLEMKSEDAHRIKDNVPEELLARPQWVCYRSVRDDERGKFNKVPINSRTGGKASSTNPATWGSFDEAVAGATKRRLSGIGFVFSENDPYFGIDIDECITEDGEVEEWAKVIIDRLNSYVEITPSGKGFHIIGRGKLPPGRRKKGQVEMYDSGRYFTVSGYVENGHRKIRECQAELEPLHAEIFNSEPKPSLSHNGGIAYSLTDGVIIEKAMNAKGGEVFRKLWAGIWEDAGYASQSEGDLALVSKLGFWTNYDVIKTDALFRQSGLFLHKWDEAHYGDGRTYGQGTINTAFKGNSFGDGYCSAPLINQDVTTGKINLEHKHQTDLEVARFMVKQHGRDLRYCYTWGC